MNDNNNKFSQTNGYNFNNPYDIDNILNNIDYSNPETQNIINNTIAQDKNLGGFSLSNPILNKKLEPVKPEETWFDEVKDAFSLDKTESGFQKAGDRIRKTWEKDAGILETGTQALLGVGDVIAGAFNDIVIDPAEVVLPQSSEDVISDVAGTASQGVIGSAKYVADKTGATELYKELPEWAKDTLGFSGAVVSTAFDVSGFGGIKRLPVKALSETNDIKKLYNIAYKPLREQGLTKTEISDFVKEIQNIDDPDLIKSIAFKHAEKSITNRVDGMRKSYQKVKTKLERANDDAYLIYKQTTESLGKKPISKNEFFKLNDINTKAISNDIFNKIGDDLLRIAPKVTNTSDKSLILDSIKARKNFDELIKTKKGKDLALKMKELSKDDWVDTVIKEAKTNLQKSDLDNIYRVKRAEMEGIIKPKEIKSDFLTDKQRQWLKERENVLERDNITTNIKVKGLDKETAVKVFKAQNKNISYKTFKKENPKIKVSKLQWDEAYKIKDFTPTEKPLHYALKKNGDIEVSHNKIKFNQLEHESLKGTLKSLKKELKKKNIDWKKVKPLTMVISERLHDYMSTGFAGIVQDISKVGDGKVIQGVLSDNFNGVIIDSNLKLRLKRMLLGTKDGKYTNQKLEPLVDSLIDNYEFENGVKFKDAYSIATTKVGDDRIFRYAIPKVEHEKMLKGIKDVPELKVLNDEKSLLSNQGYIDKLKDRLKTWGIKSKHTYLNSFVAGTLWYESKGLGFIADKVFNAFNNKFTYKHAKLKKLVDAGVGKFSFLNGEFKFNISLKEQKELQRYFNAWTNGKDVSKFKLNEAQIKTRDALLDLIDDITPDYYKFVSSTRETGYIKKYFPTKGDEKKLLNIRKKYNEINNVLTREEASKSKLPSWNGISTKARPVFARNNIDNIEILSDDLAGIVNGYIDTVADAKYVVPARLEADMVFSDPAVKEAFEITYGTATDTKYGIKVFNDMQANIKEMFSPRKMDAGDFAFSLLNKIGNLKYLGAFLTGGGIGTMAKQSLTLPSLIGTGELNISKFLKNSSDFLDEMIKKGLIKDKDELLEASVIRRSLADTIDDSVKIKYLDNVVNASTKNIQLVDKSLADRTWKTLSNQELEVFKKVGIETTDETLKSIIDITNRRINQHFAADSALDKGAALRTSLGKALYKFMAPTVAQTTRHIYEIINARSGMEAAVKAVRAYGVLLSIAYAEDMIQHVRIQEDITPADTVVMVAKQLGPITNAVISAHEMGLAGVTKGESIVALKVLGDLVKSIDKAWYKNKFAESAIDTFVPNNDKKLLFAYGLLTNTNNELLGTKTGRTLIKNNRPTYIVDDWQEFARAIIGGKNNIFASSDTYDIDRKRRVDAERIKNGLEPIYSDSEKEYKDPKQKFLYIFNKKGKEKETYELYKTFSEDDKRAVLKAIAYKKDKETNEFIIDKESKKYKAFKKLLVSQGEYKDIKKYITPDMVHISHKSENELNLNKKYLQWAKENNYAGLTGDKIRKLKKYELESNYKLWKSDKDVVKRELRKLGFKNPDVELAQWHSYISINGYPLEYKQIMSWLNEHENDDIITSEDKKWLNSKVESLRKKIGSHSIVKAGLNKLYKFADKIKKKDILNKVETLLSRGDRDGAEQYFMQQNKKMREKLYEEVKLIIKKYEK